MQMPDIENIVILSNGNLHYFWDLEQGNPVLITEFPTFDPLVDTFGMRTRLSKDDIDAAKSTAANA